ncbi:hypothetical protein CJ030_MR4G023302 [Morella rubra]|uniref:Uncharacterized protein n=1 Tax=Morella rubra TaxID=262757 RepID=A0A6A1VRV3_9ROSI|nr:hypothetical protein CJ030_MR4G023302 [Morella rubra]
MSPNLLRYLWGTSPNGTSRIHLPPVPRVEDFDLVNVDPALLQVIPPPPALPVEGNGDNEIIDLTSDTESEMD